MSAFDCVALGEVSFSGMRICRSREGGIHDDAKICVWRLLKRETTGYRLYDILFLNSRRVY